jgi:hypothetical protein
MISWKSAVADFAIESPGIGVLILQSIDAGSESHSGRPPT